VLSSEDSSSVSQLRTKIKEINPTVLLLSPNEKVNESKKQEILEEAFPEMFANKRMDNIGEMMESPEVPELKYVVQTGFYNRPGYLKFRDMLWYRSNKYNLFEKTPLSVTRKIANKNNFNKIVDKNAAALKSDLLSTYFYLIYDSSSVQGNELLNDCLQQAEDLGVFINIIPSGKVDELLLENSFLEDLTQKGGTVILGNKSDLSKIQSQMQNERVVFHALK
jgi:hypothetical protein